MKLIPHLNSYGRVNSGIALVVVLWIGLAETSLLGCRKARGCTVPVFQYAIENWPADSYEVFVFHKGPLSSSESSAVEWLTQGTRGPANCRVLVVNVASSDNRPPVAIWDRNHNQRLPCVVVRYPLQDPNEPDLWTGPLDTPSAQRILDSPVRRQLADRLAAGDAAAWVLLDSGDTATDARAAAVLGHELERQSRRPIASIPSDGSAAPTTNPVRASFSMVRLGRDDAAEEVFIRMLLASEPDLDTFHEPIAFAIFGRGRLLHALVGQGISPEMIGRTCAFLANPCSCQIKVLNPGVDLLMNVDWDRVVASIVATRPFSEPPSATTRVETEGGRRLLSSTMGSAMRNTAITLGVIAVAVAGIAVSVWWRSSRNRSN